MPIPDYVTTARDRLNDFYSGHRCADDEPHPHGLRIAYGSDLAEFNRLLRDLIHAEIRWSRERPKEN